MKSLFRRFPKPLASILFIGLSCKSFAQTPQINTEQSLYLGEVRNVELELPENITGQNLSWQVDTTKLLAFNSGDLIKIDAQNAGNKLNILIAIPYISPSFEDIAITLIGTDASNTTGLQVNLDLTVRAELVIRFRKAAEGFKQNQSLSRQSRSAFEWDLPLDPNTGDYLPLSVNNHRRGLWVRFRYDDPSGEKLLRSGG